MTVYVLHYESRGFLRTLCIAMEYQTLVQKHRKQIDVLVDAAQLAFQTTPSEASITEVGIWDRWVVDFFRSPVSKATCRAGRDQ